MANSATAPTCSSVTTRSSGGRSDTQQAGHDADCEKGRRARQSQPFEERRGGQRGKQQPYGKRKRWEEVGVFAHG
jgi:hypothetical protein